MPLWTVTLQNSEPALSGVAAPSFGRIGALYKPEGAMVLPASNEAEHFFSEDCMKPHKTSEIKTMDKIALSFIIYFI